MLMYKNSISIDPVLLQTMMEQETLEKMSKKDLQTLLTNKRHELQQMRFKTAQGQFKDIRQIRKTKKNIARICTVLKGK